MDTLVDAESPVSITDAHAIDAVPVTERTPPPDPRDYPRSETKIALFGLRELPKRSS